MPFSIISTVNYLPMILLKILELVVKNREAGLRLDKFIQLHFPGYSRTYFQKLIEKGHIRLNDEKVKPSLKVEPGDTLRVNIPPPEETGIEPEKIPLNIVFEDGDVIVIDKPAGMVVHPGAGIRSGTLVNALLYHCKDLSGVGGRLRPGIVHRLDKNTSGLMVAAKNDPAHIHLVNQLSEKTMAREYEALVWFRLQDDEGEIETYLGRSKRDRKKFTVTDEGRQAITRFRVLERFDFITLMNLQLQTGRTHQIRVHLNHIHHPVFGDPEYNGRNRQLGQIGKHSDKILARELLKMIDRQALHSRRLQIVHPVSGKKMEFESPLPPDMQSVLGRLKNSKDQF